MMAFGAFIRWLTRMQWIVNSQNSEMSTPGNGSTKAKSSMSVVEAAMFPFI